MSNLKSHEIAVAGTVCTTFSKFKVYTKLLIRRRYIDNALYFRSREYSDSRIYWPRTRHIFRRRTRDGCDKGGAVTIQDHCIGCERFSRWRRLAVSVSLGIQFNFSSSACSGKSSNCPTVEKDYAP